MKYKINSNIDIKDFILNIKENFKADAKVLHNQRNVIKLFEINGRKYVVKSFKVPHLLNRIIYSFFRKSKAERSYINTKELESLNIGTPHPVAYIEFYSLFFIKESFYISEYFDFDHQMSDPLFDENFNDRGSVFKQFVKFTYEIHNKGVFHSDYNHGNILFKNNKGAYEFSLIDVNRMKFMTLNDDLRMKSVCRLTEDLDTLELIVNHYHKVANKDFSYLMNLLAKHLDKFKEYQKNKQLLKKITQRKSMSKSLFLKFFVKEYRKKIANKLFNDASGIVDRGPFKNMKLGQKVHWGKADVAAKIYGLYESEILDIIKDKKFDTLINLGAADGYYPIGMLMHNMISHAYCFEENPLGEKYINENAKLNGVSKNISMFGRADAKFYSQLPEEVVGKNNLLLCDIEGGEFDLFTKDMVSAFDRSMFIIELHDEVFEYDNAAKERKNLVDLFSDFDVQIIQSAPKQWSDIPQISVLSDNDRALICSEGRRGLGEWLIATPKNMS